jgi:hypothetical protein
MRAKLARRFILARPNFGLEARQNSRKFTFSIAAHSSAFTTENYGKALSRLGLEGDLFYSKENLRKAFAEVNAEVELDDVTGKILFLDFKIFFAVLAPKRQELAQMFEL